jgi:hypothetical protein
MDFLAVPAERPDLLLAGREDAHVRKDLFDAFTRINPRQRAWYDRATDAIRWVDRGSDEPEGNLLQLPELTEETETTLRREFVDNVQDDSAKAVLLSSLEGTLPLRAFSAAVHASGLQGAWRRFVTRRVLERIRDWAAQAEIPWGHSWVHEDESAAPRLTSVVNKSNVRAGASTIAADLARRNLLQAITNLPDEDLARIPIPMDVVLRMFERR